MFDATMIGAGILCFGLAAAGMTLTAYEFQRLEKREA